MTVVDYQNLLSTINDIGKVNKIHTQDQKENYF